MVLHIINCRVFLTVRSCLRKKYIDEFRDSFSCLALASITWPSGNPDLQDFHDKSVWIVFHSHFPTNSKTNGLSSGEFHYHGITSSPHAMVCLQANITITVSVSPHALICRHVSVFFLPNRSQQTWCNSSHNHK